ncbi:MAG: hypothetical protein KIS77_04145 [Saprospiraceae bacterium]|nr:hypothetical protein [Saprospiraceae bacterium]
MIRRLSIFIFFVLNCLCAIKAQSWRIHLNVNEYYPINAPEKGYYPILWYSSTEGRGVLLGGFGGSVSWTNTLKSKWDLKVQLNISRSRYYDEPAIVLDENGFAYGAVIGIATNLNLSALGIPRYSVADWLDVGAGLGLQSVILAKSDYGKAKILGEKKELNFTNKSLQPVVLVLPVETTVYFWDRFSFSTRLEFALTKVSRLSYASNERSMLLVLEAGYRLNRANKPMPVTDNQ